MMDVPYIVPNKSPAKDPESDRRYYRIMTGVVFAGLGLVAAASEVSRHLNTISPGKDDRFDTLMHRMNEQGGAKNFVDVKQELPRNERDDVGQPASSLTVKDADDRGCVRMEIASQNYIMPHTKFYCPGLK